MVEVRIIAPQQTINLDSLAWVTLTTLLVDLRTGETLWEVFNVYIGDTIDLELSTIPEAKEGNQYGYRIIPKGGNNNSVQYNFTYIKNAGDLLLRAEGTVGDFGVSVDSCADFEMNEPRAARA
jgi:hypothetical protein